MTDAPDPRRRAPRSRTLRGGTIVFANGISTIKCRLRDESETGVQLTVETAAGIPDEFVLIIEPGAERKPCRVMWRKGAKLGVKFIAELGVERVDQSELAARLRAKADEMRASPAGAPAVRSRLLKRRAAL